MMNESVKRSTFNDKRSPDLEGVLQATLPVTMHKRDATRWMSQAMAEAYRSWDGSTPNVSRYIRLRNNLTKRFFSDVQQHAQPSISIVDGQVDARPARNSRLYPAMSTTAGQGTLRTGESDERVNYCEAFASLPAGFRSAMILSYIEGFSNREIADLAGVQLHAVESLLDRGRGLLQRKILARPMGNRGPGATADRTAARG